MLNVLISSCISWQCIANISADYYKINRQLVKALITVESTNCKFTQNKYTKASGCLQIHPIHTPDRLALEMLRNPKHGIPEGVRLLSGFKHPCQYNLGKRGMKLYPEACQRYMAKLRRTGLWNTSH